MIDDILCHLTSLIEIGAPSCVAVAFSLCLPTRFYLLFVLFWFTVIIISIIIVIHYYWYNYYCDTNLVQLLIILRSIWLILWAMLINRSIWPLFIPCWYVLYVMAPFMTILCCYFIKLLLLFLIFDLDNISANQYLSVS